MGSVILYAVLSFLPAMFRNTELDLRAYIFPLILIIVGLFHWFLAYRILCITKNRNEYLVVTIGFTNVIFWILILFIGIPFASYSWMYPLFITIAVIMYVAVTSRYRSTAMALFAATLLVIGFSFVSGFEESYCWRYADKVAKADPQGLYVPTKEERAALGTVDKVASISAWYRAHLKCHREFSYTSFLKPSLTR